jgi:hypothetical protein
MMDGASARSARASGDADRGLLGEVRLGLYGPFREAGSAPSFGDRRDYQVDPGNVREALRECELDVARGRRRADGEAGAPVPDDRAARPRSVDAGSPERRPRGDVESAPRRSRRAAGTAPTS